MPDPALPTLPDGVLAFADRGPAWSDFTRSLPRLLRDLLEEWGLRVDGVAAHGRTAIVVPVRTGEATPAALKIGFVDEESAHEALALQHWRGRGAVGLLRADPRRGALLLERLDARDLTAEWDVAACEIVGGLYRDLHLPAPPQLRRLSALAGEWASRLEGLPRSAPLPRRLVEQAAHLARAFATDAATDARLVHADLHYANVLADGDPDDGGRWRVIDPKPISGDPHFEPAPLLWNRFDELAGDVRDGLRRRFHAVVDAAGLDEDRARDWVVVRAMVNALGAVDGTDTALDSALDSALDPGLDPTGRTDRVGWLTTCVALAKAVQD